jgi:hypothetical protein
VQHPNEAASFGLPLIWLANAAGAGTWTSSFPGKYLEGGKEAGGQLVDQRLLPRIDEGEVRILMAGDTCQMAIHKKPMGGGLSAVGGSDG